MNSDNTQSVILGSIEKIVNKVLSLDEETLMSLAVLTGKVFEIDILNTDIRIFILPTIEGITLVSEYEGKADVAIKGQLASLVNMITAGKIGVGDIEIDGSVGLAQKFQSILKNMDVDWEEYLSHFIGDMATRKTANLLKGVSRFAITTGKTIGLDISEYLRYEKETVLDKSELDKFNQSVDELRNDLDRLQKRVARLDEENA